MWGERKSINKMGRFWNKTKRKQKKIEKNVAASREKEINKQIEGGGIETK